VWFISYNIIIYILSIGVSSGVGTSRYRTQQPCYRSVDTMTTCCLSIVFLFRYITCKVFKYIYIKEKYRHLRLFSRSGGGGGPLTRKRLFCIIHEFFIRFVHHPPGNCIHTRIHTYTLILTYTLTHIHTYISCTICIICV